jgi:hypothetical protein
MAVLIELRQQRLDRKVWKAGIELKGFCTMESDDGGGRQCLGRVSSKWKFEGEEGRGGATLTCVMVAAGRAT